MILKRALIVRKPWIDLILSSQKTWEMRSRPTTITGDIGLIEAGSGLIVGHASLIGCVSMDGQSWRDTLDKHCIEDSRIWTGNWQTAWQLNAPLRFTKPIPYEHPRGAVVWVNIENLGIESCHATY